MRRYLNTWLDAMAVTAAGVIYPPRSPSGYAHFTGHIYEAPYAPLSCDAGAARAHYAEEGTPLAAVEVHENEMGIVLVGEDLLADRNLGGDWRRVDGALELVAVVVL
jgi:hypothetical protein